MRVSLKTKDTTEAHRLYFRLQEQLLAYPGLSLQEARELIRFSIKNHTQSSSQACRLRLLSMLKAHVSPEQSILLSALFEKYLQEKLRAHAWTRKTASQAEDNYRLLLRLTGDIPASQVDKVMAGRVKESLQLLPSNAMKKREYRDKSLQELIKSKIPATHLMSVKTINIKLATYSEAFNWAVSHGFSDNNPFKKIQIKDNRNVQELRLTFTVHELNSLFASTSITHARKPHHYWLPILALYTGARINELCQLYIDDIGSTDNILCMSINGNREDQSLKTRNSRRLIPLHNDLVSLGLLDYLEKQRVKGHKMLFSELNFNGQKYSHEPSKWFSRLKSKAPLIDGNRKTFHSFRHCFTDNLVNTNNWGADPIIKILLGHQNSDITTGLYGSRPSLTKLQEVIYSLNWRQLGVKYPEFIPVSK